MTPGVSRHPANAGLARHRHREGYVALVLSGGYIEAGDSGRLRAEAGTVLLHGRFCAHRDDFERRGATVLNLPLPEGVAEGAGRIDDVDRIARIAERDPREAADEVARHLRVGADLMDDWPDKLAQVLASDSNSDVVLTDWAARIGIAPQSLSRGFQRAYGVSPKRFRFESRARQTVAMLAGWTGSLAELAAARGFADQAHMARAVRAIAGDMPTALRVQSVQA